MRLMLRNQLKAGDVQVVVQVMRESHPDLKNVPLAINYAKTDAARELMRLGAHNQAATMRPYSVPPGTSKKRLAVLRKAFIETMKDPDFLAETKKAKLEINPMDGEEMEKLFDGLYKINPATLAKLQELLLPRKAK